MTPYGEWSARPFVLLIRLKRVSNKETDIQAPRLSVFTLAKHSVYVAILGVARAVSVARGLMVIARVSMQAGTQVRIQVSTQHAWISFYRPAYKQIPSRNSWNYKGEKIKGRNFFMK